MKRPHLIIIMADQLRWDAFGEHTPNLNQLRAESVDFERAYCASPICVPARGAFFSGRYPNETGCLINPWEPREAQHGQVKAGTPHLYGILEQEWDSWHTGKQHFYHADQPDRQAGARTNWRSFGPLYSEYMKKSGKRKPGGPAYKGLAPEMYAGRTTRAMKYSIPTIGRYAEGAEYFFDRFIMNTSLEAIAHRDPSKPFLLNAMFLAPHPPLEVPEPWYSSVQSVQLPDNVGRWSPNQSPLQLYNVTGSLGSRYTREDWQQIWPVYMGLVSLLDDCVGQLIAELKRQGMYDDSLILFTSDHGEMLGSHCLWQKMCMYEESARIPLFFKLPQADGTKPRQIQDSVSAIDVLPTLCDYLQLEAPPGLPGLSLVPYLLSEGEGEQQQMREDQRPIFIQYDGNGARGNFQRCVVQGQLKLIVDLFKDEIFLELYDLKMDPQEHVNLAFDEACQLQILKLLDTLRQHMLATGDALTLPESLYEAFLTEYAPFAK